MKPHKIILAGGTGFLGQVLVDHWKDSPIDIVVLSRKPYTSHDRVRYVTWDGKSIGTWANELNKADVLINLAGRTVDCRYTAENKRQIIESRIKSTAVLGQAIRQTDNPPLLWINLSSATIYRHAPDRQMDEITGETDSPQAEHRFSQQVCKEWEQTFWESDTPEVRKVALRSSLVLGRDGGVFPVLKRLTRFGLGGQQGDGDQFISWLHEHDFARIIDFLIRNDTLDGTFNCTAPCPIRNTEFMTLLRRAFGAPVGLPATRWMLEIGAFLLRTETELVLKSRNVIPRKLQEAGFRFVYPTASEALTTLVK